MSETRQQYRFALKEFGFIKNAVKLPTYLANVVDAKSLLFHPATTICQQLSLLLKRSLWCYLRYAGDSPGIEHIDVIADFEQAFVKLT